MSNMLHQDKDKTVAILCECGDKGHTIYLSVLDFEDPAHIEIVMCPNHMALWDRIKQAFKLILGHDIIVSDAVWDAVTARELAKWIFRKTTKRSADHVGESDN